MVFPKKYYPTLTMRGIVRQKIGGGFAERFSPQSLDQRFYAARPEAVQFQFFHLTTKTALRAAPLLRGTLMNAFVVNSVEFIVFLNPYACAWNLCRR